MPETPAPTSVLIRCGQCSSLNRVPQERLFGKPVCGGCKTALDIPQEPIHAKVASFDRAIAYWAETLLVEFTSSACLYCKIVDPVVNELARLRVGKLKVMKVDVDRDEYLVQRFKIKKTPTFLVYRNGEEILRVDGPPKEKTDLKTWIDNLINFSSY